MTTTDDHEAFEADTKAIVSKVLEGARAQLQDAFPYMSSVAIERMVEKSNEYFQNEIQAQEQAIAASKARINFFTLPPELRNCIYELALTEEKVPRPDEHANWEVDHQVEIQRWECCGEAVSSTKRSVSTPLRPTKRPALLSVSREVRSEVLSIYYAVSVFTITYARWQQDYKLAEWLQTIGRDQAAMIKELHIRFYMMPPDEVGKRDVIEAYNAVKDGVKDAAITVVGNWSGVGQHDGAGQPLGWSW